MISDGDRVVTGNGKDLLGSGDRGWLNERRRHQKMVAPIIHIN